MAEAGRVLGIKSPKYIAKTKQIPTMKAFPGVVLRPRHKAEICPELTFVKNGHIIASGGKRLLLPWTINNLPGAAGAV